MARSVAPGRPRQALRVAVVSDSWYPYFKGGKEVRSYELFRRLAHEGVDVHVYTMRWWDGPPVIHQGPLTLHAICSRRAMYSRGRRSIVEAVIFAFACVRLLTVRADVIDADQMPYLQLFPLQLIAWIRRIPLVVTWHEWWGRNYWRNYLGRAGAIAALLERLISRVGALMVVTTSSTAGRLTASGVAARRVIVLPLGVDGSAIAKAPPATERTDVSFVGRLLEHKHVDVLLRSLALLCDEGTPLTCAIIGEGPEFDHLQSLAGQLGIEHSIRFLGRLEDQADVWGVMKSASVFALPSTREGFGIAVLEAIACGAIVVTSNHPENDARHLITSGVTGFAVEATADHFAEGLRCALRLSASAPMGRGAVAGWESSTRQLLDLYQQLLADTRATPRP